MQRIGTQSCSAFGIYDQCTRDSRVPLLQTLPAFAENQLVCLRVFLTTLTMLITKTTAITIARSYSLSDVFMKMYLHSLSQCDFMLIDSLGIDGTQALGRFIIFIIG